ncbi:glutaredoxin family protein [Ureibacillus composti]|uniref:Glutaredoxin family protein n=1 Tax=Lysinibacillus composti TaxID=720633 RepID=A0A3N9UEF5_9BACI|nr:glutaredoxin family protein [Lysinibacillus composti]MBM7608647.1 glutaredoxin [Lysinibacillus composti]MDM5334996.1 glutaredoxin family protein [Ureibacillus composti]RQW74565.1 glutaredoxin family protein [Lysinibacillus composti]
MNVKFYSRPNCSLCTDGLMTLKLVQEELQFDIELINIEENHELHEKFMIMIPVVEYNEQILQYGILDYVTLYEELNKVK